ncbi:gliding motility-associated C-terminal domain-containing protein [Hyunsoonleella jejuensis]|uniref:Gliding motility-associated C-terminal domain-containing protein n=1 Tax=Hyunsoonleella jejuensis TaxID=419940 RepID=A0A1H9JJ90_9FLAO|nr:choice-of-anchor L domain-containing protein [Hyunsoonleella jejuensis]SEQ86843.1 gliding motility-associated C-terminal domain-containing protein [Hyunsoonleella jejuensis]
MKQPPHFNIILIALIFSAYSLVAQQINVNGNVTVNQLIEDNLVDGCVEVSNVTSLVNGDSNGFRSFAEFSRGTSNFPFESGIMLSTGNAESGGNTLITTDLSEGATTWGTDLDLEAALGSNNFLNATSIEFDFVSISNQVQFNYLLASEEYSGINPCQFSDGFAFLIREASSTGPYQNIAVVPGTTTPVSTNTVHDEIVGVCPAQNEQYFDGYNIGDTNYNGRTEVLTATATIIPYVQYHIKLVIADQADQRFDSAVFIEGDSFKILDLGEDISTCASSVTLDADIQNPSSTYQWFLNGSTTPISGETNTTLNVTQSGNYRVEITTPLGSSSCIEEDEIIVNIQNEITLNGISDYQLCDDLSGDEVETFDLSTKDAELATIINFTNFTFSYHLSDAEARSGNNQITSPIQNTSLSQPIFVRIDDLDSGCVAYTSFNIVVNTIPNITPPANLAICDSDNDPSDGFTTIDLSVKNDEITSGDNNLVVTYHYNTVDANNGNNPIPIPYINSNTPTESLFVRVVNASTGCYTTSTLTVDITNSPIVNRDPIPLDGCDTDHDGTDTFDLTQAINDILQGLTGVSTTFHESLADANEGINAIANETNYQNITPDVQTVFVRIEDNITGCASVVPLEIHTNLLLTGTDTGDFALCDDGSNDGIADFNLYVVETYIANELPGVTVTFYETQTDFDNNNPLDKNQIYAASNPTNLIISIGNGSCTEVSDINLLVNPVLVFNPIAPVPYCDDDDDGVVSIELATFDDLITAGNIDFTVSYFGSQTDADTNINPLPPFYANTSPTETIYARIENIDTGCNTVEVFEIEVRPAPPISQPSPWLICDNDDDGLTILNLNDKIPEIVTSTSGLDINFFTAFDEANNNTNPITDVTNFETGTQTVYVRVESTVSGCYAIANLEIIVNTVPVFGTISNFQLCEDDNDERTEFLFSDWDAEILNGQTGKEVFYFEDAAFTTPIDKTSLYTNTSSPQTIYVRVENITDANCNATSSFFIEVGANPDYNPPSSFLICDDNSNDGIGVFDLNEKIEEISQGSTTNLDINFFLSEFNALENINPIPLAFTNTTNPQQLYVRIDNQDSDCFVVEDFGINVVAAPDLSDADIFDLCDDDYDGFVTFDLDNAQYENFDRIQTGTVVNYFENIDDVDNDALAITNPNTYVSNSKTVYIKVTNTLTTCYTVLPLQLAVTPLPIIQFNGTYEICDNDADIFDLSIMDDIIVEDLSTVGITYYSNPTDAQNNNNALSTNFNYTSNSHVIYTRMEDLSTGCIGYGSFTLQVNQNPIANPPQDLIYCDDDFDGILQFNLVETAADILGTQNASDYEISYHSSSVDAQDDINPLDTFHEVNLNQTIYARLENRNTGCYAITQFNTQVLPLPVIPINDVVALCTDDLPLTISAETGNAGDTYLWSNGATTPEITLVNASQIGTYAVTVTKSNGCMYTQDFEVIESQQAPLNPSTTVNFADPNSITVNIDANATGDYRFILDNGEPQTSNVFDNVTIGSHDITVIDLNGCSPAYDTVFIFDIPKFVTPNNDGFFDRWHITGADQLPGTLVYIYNRHGKLLKMLPHNSPGWDGTFNGANMPADDYWFSADIVHEGESFNIRGHFALKR